MKESLNDTHTLTAYSQQLTLMCIFWSTLANSLANLPLSNPLIRLAAFFNLGGRTHTYIYLMHSRDSFKFTSELFETTQQTPSFIALNFDPTHNKVGGAH